MITTSHRVKRVIAGESSGEVRIVTRVVYLVTAYEGWTSQCGQRVRHECGKSCPRWDFVLVTAQFAFATMIGGTRIFLSS